MTTVQSDVIANCLNTPTNIYSLRKRERGRDRMAKNAKKMGMEQHPIPLEKPVSNKQPSLISSIRRIQRSKKNATHTQVRSADRFFLNR